jgi:uncharacterized protein (DUF362 family)
MTSLSGSSNFSGPNGKLSRRDFTRRAVLAAAGLTLRDIQETETPSPLALAQNEERAAALSTVLGALGPQDFEGKPVYLKANFNSPDDFPATTHPDMLSLVVSYLRENKATEIVVLERSGMGLTRAIWQKLGIIDLAKRLDLKLLPLEELPPHEWREEPLPGGHWKRGVEVPGFLREACVVQICNLKTHRFGGHFSASLKNSIGLVAKFATRGEGYNYMEELHASAQQRLMIAEANQIYQPALVVMDASQVFIDAGPEKGEIANPRVIVASRDRIAVDAVGIGLLRLYGAGYPLSRGSVFEQEQVSRAVELKLGVQSPKGIQILTSDDASRKLAGHLTAAMEKMPDEKK